MLEVLVNKGLRGCAGAFLRFETFTEPSPADKTATPADETAVAVSGTAVASDEIAVAVEKS